MIKSRMQRRKSRQRHGVAGLNLVSMIDVLSILMFFLLATAGQVPLLELMPELHDALVERGTHGAEQYATPWLAQRTREVAPQVLHGLLE